jgi:hypothetical protein
LVLAGGDSVRTRHRAFNSCFGSWAEAWSAGNGVAANDKANIKIALKRMMGPALCEPKRPKPIIAPGDARFKR